MTAYSVQSYCAQLVRLSNRPKGFDQRAAETHRCRPFIERNVPSVEEQCMPSDGHDNFYL